MSVETLLAESKHFGMKRRQQPLYIIEAVHAAVSEWSKIFKECHVPGRDAESMGDVIRHWEIRRLPKRPIGSTG